MNVGGVFYESPADPHQEVLRPLREAGTTHARADAAWSDAEQEPPQSAERSYSWRWADHIATHLTIAELRWSPVLAYSPRWASTVPGTAFAPPREDTDFAAFAQSFAARYGRDGEFWRERHNVGFGEPRQLGPIPVTRYEIWNEPNLRAFWRPAPDPARYARLYVAARNAIKDVDPNATVLVGGLAPNNAESFVRELMGNSPPPRIDGVGFHPYARSAPLALRAVGRLRKTLDAVGGRKVPIFITEIGWPTQGVGDLGVPPLPDATRAGNLRLLGEALVRSDCRVKSFEPFTWISRERDSSADHDWLGIYSSRGPTDSTRAYAALIAYLEDRRSQDELAVCYRAHRASAKPVRLGLALSKRRSGATGKRCYDAAVSYRGFPLNGVSLVRGRDTRGRQHLRRTDARGTALFCVSRATFVRAEIAGVAHSRARWLAP